MEDNLLREINNDKQVPKNKRIVNEDGLFEAEEDLQSSRSCMQVWSTNPVRTHLNKTDL